MDSITIGGDLVELIETNTGYSIEELRKNAEELRLLEDKFSTKAIYGKSCFREIVKDLNAQDSMKGCISEFFLIRQKIINSRVNKRQHCKILQNTKKNSLINRAAILTYLIEEILPSEIFWAMEYLLEEGEEFSEEEMENYELMEKIAQIYIEETEDLRIYYGLPAFSLLQQ